MIHKIMPKKTQTINMTNTDAIYSTCCSNEGCKTKGTKDGDGFGKVHGTQKMCVFKDCTNFAQGKGLCTRHGYTKPRCKHDGCTNQAVKNRVYKCRGGKRTCAIQYCDRSVKQAGLCQYHYRCLLCIDPVELGPTIKSVLSLLGFEVLAYVGMAKDKGAINAIDKWDYVFAVGCVCKS
jgi:hypothetical protein